MMTTPPHNGTKPENDVPCISSERLLGDRSQLIIVHEGEEYKLTKTSRGKLILTK